MLSGIDAQYLKASKRHGSRDESNRTFRSIANYVIKLVEADRNQNFRPPAEGHAEVVGTAWYGVGVLAQVSRQRGREGAPDLMFKETFTQRAK